MKINEIFYTDEEHKTLHIQHMKLQALIQEIPNIRTWRLVFVVDVETDAEGIEIGNRWTSFERGDSGYAKNGLTRLAVDEISKFKCEIHGAPKELKNILAEISKGRNWILIVETHCDRIDIASNMKCRSELLGTVMAVY